MFVIKLKKLKNSKFGIFYSIVVMNQYKSIGSNLVFEKIGFYSSSYKKLNNKIFFINFDRLSYWLKKGAFINYKLKFLIHKIYYVNSLKN